MIQAKLAIGPMSSEIIEAVYRYSHRNVEDLMLIASKNQIDFDGGYVNKWTTADYARFLNTMTNKYPKSRVFVCRDHCGPGFRAKVDSKEDIYKTVEEDILNGFHLLHLDLCRYEVSHEEKIEETKSLMRFALKLNPDIMFEVGTDENDGDVGSFDLEAVERDVRSICEVAKPVFYVLQTGSLVKEAKQAGGFDKNLVSRFCELLGRYDIKLKEHNADYLPSDQIAQRLGLVGAVNIAPQLGVLQTSTVLTQCLVYGVSVEAFMRLVWGGGKWKKWSLGHLDNLYGASLVAGHYHFTSQEWQDILQGLSSHLDVPELVMQSVEKVINHYLKAL